jgi:predicted ribosome quality control (RQC) complex YloA/Tae2 family protein
MIIMDVKISLKKSVEENASVYFDLAKKQKAKLGKAQEAKEKTERKLKKARSAMASQMESEKTAVRRSRKPDWYEKFRWFYTSDSMLVIGGRDATQNEIIIKKHTEPEDIVFHTDMAGSPFFVVKTGKKKPSEQGLKEAASETAIFSRAWKLGHTTAAVFHVKPDQVTKQAQAGEYLSKGSFMIRGKTTYVQPKMELGIALKDGRIISGPTQAIQKQSDKVIRVIQGPEKPGRFAKKIAKLLDFHDLDEIIRMLPSSGLAMAE